MEFHEVIELARRKQLKHNREVKQLERINERKAKSLVENHTKSKQSCDLKLQNVGRLTSISGAPISNATDSKSNDHVKKFQSKAEKVTRQSIGTIQTHPDLSGKDVKADSKHGKPVGNALCAPQASKVRGALVKEASGLARSTHVSSHQSAANPTGTKATPKLSFSDILELAKKNVVPESTKKTLFDDLIPCSVSSKYRAMNGPNKQTDSLRSAHSLSPEPSRLNLLPKVSTCNQKSIQSNSVSIKRNPLTMDSKSRTNEHVRGSDSIQDRLQQSSENKDSTTKPSKSAIAQQRRPDSAKVNKPTPSNPATVPASQLHRKPHDTLQTHHAKTADRTPVRDPSVAAIHPHRKPLQASQTNHIKTIDRTSVCEPSIAVKRVSSEAVTQRPKIPGNTVPKRISSQDAMNKPVSQSSQPVLGRGIAAQLGVCAALNQHDSQYSSEEEDYESDDSFIDDSEAVDLKDYAKVVHDVHKALRFDPRKYKAVNPWDDLRSMEANYREIEKEEKRSARIAAQEDAAELERDMERKRRKLARM